MRKLKQFFKTPKGLLTIILVLLTLIAAPGEGWAAVGAGMGASVLAAGLLDLFILRVRKDAPPLPAAEVEPILVQLNLVPGRRKGVLGKRLAG